MDGNGRWAESRGYERTFGHIRGARVAKTIIEKCANIGVKHLTLYAFSTENWMRPLQEVSFLMQLLGRHLRRERATLLKNNIRFTTIGDLSRLPAPVRAEVLTTVEQTSKNTGMHLVFALSYGARQEITKAMRVLAEQVRSGLLSPEDINDCVVSTYLETTGTPDPDLIIRTSGEYRLSNFLLWQAAYSELYITQALWPDFGEDELERAFQFFANRERRFGKVASAASSITTTAVTAANPMPATL